MKLLKIVFLIFGSVLGTAWLGAARQQSFDEAFVFVFVDQQAEDEFKGPPFDRSLYARAVDRCRELGAKGVVIKLFLDREYTPAGDEALAAAMSRIPVVMQARIEPQTGTPAEIPERCAFAVRALPVNVSGERGWIPIPRFAAAAAAVGFVDFADEDIPLLEGYRDKTYKSVVVCALELQTGEHACLNEAGKLTLGNRTFPANAHYVMSIQRSLAPLPAYGLADLLSGKVDGAKIRGKVVIFGWVGPPAGVITTPEGKIPVHVYFGQCLRAVFESVSGE
jgi:CHASE2 domain-containing sensor protein